MAAPVVHAPADEPPKFRPTGEPMSHMHRSRASPCDYVTIYTLSRVPAASRIQNIGNTNIVLSHADALYEAIHVIKSNSDRVKARPPCPAPPCI